MFFFNTIVLYVAFFFHSLTCKTPSSYIFPWISVIQMSSSDLKMHHIVCIYKQKANAWNSNDIHMTAFNFLEIMQEIKIKTAKKNVRRCESVCMISATKYVIVILNTNSSYCLINFPGCTHLVSLWVIILRIPLIECGSRPTNLRFPSIIYCQFPFSEPQAMRIPEMESHSSHKAVVSSNLSLK